MYGYSGQQPSACINTSGQFQINPQKTQIVHADPGSSAYKVTYLSPITTQPTAGQVVVAPSKCAAQYPMVVDLSQAYKTSVGGGQCQPCHATTSAPSQPQVSRRINRCCPGCAPCCCGECDTYEDYPMQSCCCPAQPGANHSKEAAPQCCSCHGCQAMCCGQPCCVCHPCQTNDCCNANGGCCGPNGGCCGPNCCGPTGGCYDPDYGCCGQNGCCGPNGGCCGPNGNCCGPNCACCGPNGGCYDPEMGCCGQNGCCGPNRCCGNCCMPVTTAPPAQTATITAQPVSVNVAPTNGPYVYRTSYNMAGFVPYNGQAVSVIPADNKFMWGGSALQPYTNVARQVFVQ